jgi:hypothetical protein
LLKAAARGSVKAMDEYARLISADLNVGDRNQHADAYLWLCAAVALGQAESSDHRDLSKKQLSADQRNACQRQAEKIVKYVRAGKRVPIRLRSIGRPAVLKKPKRAGSKSDAVSKKTKLNKAMLAPGAAASDISVTLGKRQLDGASVIWRPSVRSSPHLFVVGIPGQGKTVAVDGIVRDLAAQGVPSVVIDFHGTHAADSPTRAGGAQSLRVNLREGLPFSPFEADLSQVGSQSSSARLNCFGVAEIFGYVCQLGDMQQDLVYQALCRCYELQNGDTAGSSADHRQRNARMPTIEDVRKTLEDLESEQNVSNVVARCRPLLDFGLFNEADDRQVLTGSEIFSRGLVLDLHECRSPMLQVAAGAFLLRHVYKAMFGMPKVDRVCLAIVVDEAHLLAKDATLPRLMKEGRKFGISVILASQGMKDFNPDVIDNSGSRIVFRTNHPASKKISEFLSAPKTDDLKQRVEQLAVGTAYVQTSEMQYSAIVDMQPPLAKRNGAVEPPR